jgi:squalene-associated FAD-dependent desaturase
MQPSAHVGIVGGGLAGLAAATSLAAKGIRVEIFEAHRSLGGRATTFYDGAESEPVDYCQPVSLGCDSNFALFMKSIGATKQLERHSRLHLFGPDGKRSDLYAIPGLPAPFHLAASFLRLGFLTMREKWRIIKGLRELAGPISEEDADLSILRWLRLHDQTASIIDRFWSPVLANALGGKLENTSLAAARKRVLDQFLLSRTGYIVETPTTSLRQIIDEQATSTLAKLGASVHLSTQVRMILGSADRCQGILRSDGAAHPFDIVIVAVPWRLGPSLLSANLRAAIPQAPLLEQWPASPITGLHLWFDRPLSPLSHAILINRLTHWVFRRHPRAAADTQTSSGFYYQVILSAACDLDRRTEESILEEVQRDLATIWPASRGASLLRSQIVIDPQAIFTYPPRCDAWRPSQETSVPNLMLAGDWTQTGHPSTMESALRSGYLAAEAVLRYLGRPAPLMAPDPPPEWLAKRLFPEKGVRNLF